MHRRGDRLLEAIARGRERDAPPAPARAAWRAIRPTPRWSSLAQALVRHRSMEEGVAVELIATQSELSALVSALRRGEDGDHVRVAHGWRRELVGDELRELVGGPPRAERGRRRRAARQRRPRAPAAARPRRSAGGSRRPCAS